MNNEEKEYGFRMVYDKNTIDHLGIKLYSSFPPVIAELVSNSFDAEAANVDIIISYMNKSVKVQDNGHGMNHEELNKSFLRIGRNRRVDQGNGLSKNGKRKVTGKKGLGKLAVFGIAKTIRITSVSDGISNSLEINYDDMKNSPTAEYEPKALSEYEPSKENNGTLVEIEDITLSNISEILNLANSLSKRFNFFDAEFEVNIINEDSGEKLLVDKNLFFDSLIKQFSWSFPEDFSELIEKDLDVKSIYNKQVNGKIYTKSTPLEKKDTGFLLYVRSKFASENTFFNDRSNDRFNMYVTGFFNIDFIDESDSKDYIATARQSILWDQSEELLQLRSALNKIINRVGNEWRTKRKEVREKELEKAIPDNIFEGLSPSEKKSIEQIKKSLINNQEDEDTETIVQILTTVKDMYQFESFQEYVVALNESDLTVENIERIANDWENIESKELAKIASGRIQAIEKFAQFIKEDASETKVIQPFLEKFPWILDPRITTFEREVTFSKILKDNFPDKDLEERNRRLDFLCNLVNSRLVIIELKRPGIKLSMKEINQALSYKEFIETNHKEAIQNGVETILISDSYQLDNEANRIYPSLEKNGALIIRSYSDLLQQAIAYNKSYIEQYEKIRSFKDSIQSKSSESV